MATRTLAIVACTPESSMAHTADDDVDDAMTYTEMVDGDEPREQRYRGVQMRHANGIGREQCDHQYRTLQPVQLRFPG